MLFMYVIIVILWMNRNNSTFSWYFLAPVFGHQNNPANLKRCPRVVVISYTMLHRLRKSMLAQEWALLIVDESHHVRCTKKASEPGEVQYFPFCRRIINVYSRDCCHFFFYNLKIASIQSTNWNSEHLTPVVLANSMLPNNGILSPWQLTKECVLKLMIFVGFLCLRALTLLNMQHSGWGYKYELLLFGSNAVCQLEN